MNKRLFLFWVFLILGFLQLNKAYAGIEPFENFIKGNLKVGDSLWVKDEKFRNTSFNWASLNHLSVKNYITLKIIDDIPIIQDFDIRFRLKVAYYSSPNQIMPTIVDTVNLKVNYKKGIGATYQLSDSYQFEGAHEIKVYIEEISSPQYGAQLPVSMQLTSGIVVDRLYTFEPYTPIPFSGTFTTSTTTGGGQMLLRGNLNNQVQLTITIPVISGADEYDLEWTPIDNPSEYSQQLYDNTITAGQLVELFKNNATRVTLAKNQQQYTISLVYNCEWIAVRLRGVHYNAEGVRVEGEWSYNDSQNGGFAIWNQINWHESNLNWQYAATYAEEGKKKEVVSYFDGSLRNRQTVTLLNEDVNVNDAVPVVQENVYDEFGRAAANILPAPIKETGVSTAYLKYFKGLNKNTAGKSYSFEDLNLDNCSPFPSIMGITSGAGGYYSQNNNFLAQNEFNKYLPNAEGYPLSVNLYTPDNTGRLAKQGGVGPTFQPGVGTIDRTTKYYYGRPEQWELDAVFGNDAGYANRYQKNMVIDPNGQASVTYLNASGKTVATALTGSSPTNVTALSSASNVKDQTINLLRPDDFKFDVSALKLIATTTYVSSIIPSGNTTLKYDISQLISRYPNVFDPCSNCFYRLKVSVKDDCGVEKNVSNNGQIIVGSALSNPQLTELATGSVELALDKIGTYFVTIELALDENVIKDYTEEFVTQAVGNEFLDKREKYVAIELKNLEQYFLTCFTGCDALSKLGTKEEFRNMFKQKIADLDNEFNPNVNNTIYDIFIDGTSNDPGLYQKLHDAAQTQENACKTPALSACDSKRKLLLEDVSPNGQYAPFDENGIALEQETNVLFLYFRAVFTGTPSPEDEIVLENGDKISPYDSSFQLADLVKYWKPAWAEKFIEFHPEYCKLQFCEQNYVSENWDSQLKKQDNAPTDAEALTGNVEFDQNLTAADWLVAHDPFFKTGGLGHDHAALMALDLNEYSKNVLKKDPNVLIGTFYPSLKNLLQVNLIQLYCSVEGSTTNSSSDPNVWNNCSPRLDCREFNREWQLYRDAYLELKQKYIDLVRKNSTCQNACEVGQPEKVDIAPKACEQVFILNSTAQKNDFGSFVQFTEIELVSGMRFFYNLVPGSANQLPTSGLCEYSSVDDPVFYPCIKIKHPAKPEGEQFYNVWKIDCVNEEVDCSSSSADFEATVRSSSNPNIFYMNVGSPQHPLWDRYTVYEGYDINTPPSTSCNPYIAPEFYRCVNVYYNNQVITYNNAYVAYCPLQPGEGPNTAGRMAMTYNTINESENRFNNILSTYLSPTTQSDIEERKEQLVTNDGTTQFHVDLLKKAIYRTLPADSLSDTSITLSTFGPFKFKEILVLNPHPKYFVKLKNVWVAELLPDSGSIKYKEQQIIQRLVEKGTLKSIASINDKSKSISSATGLQPLSITSSPCVTVFDEAVDYYYEMGCNGQFTWNEWRRTLASLSSGGVSATLPYDVTVKVEYVNVIGGPSTEINLVIPAGQSFAFYDYYGELWTNNGYGICEKIETIYKCVKTVIGADLCFADQSCAGIINCPSSYTSKISRFPVAAQQDVTAVNTDTYKDKNEQEIAELVSSAAEGHANSWMTALAPAITNAAAQNNPINETLLRNKLKELTALAGSSDPLLRDGKGNPLFINGISSLPGSLQVMVGNTACKSYGEILKAIFGITHYTNDINPWLLEGPVPYPTRDVNGKFTNKMQVVPITISSTNQEIVDKLESLKPYPTISAQDFYTYLQTTFGNTMTLTLEELEALMKACGDCKFILGKDITLPVFLEPGTKGFITKAEYDQALTDMNAGFATTPNDTWDNYETIVGNFLNHRFGFALSYNQYKQFADDNPNNPTAKLSNQPPYVEVKVDRYECTRGIIATAFYTADPLYQAYLAEEKKKFREAYITTCSAARANFKLETKQNIYHYTLYYYDQAGNLIRTVPPAGVSILSAAEQVQVQKYREFGGTACDYQGPTTATTANTVPQQLSNTLNAAGNHALEFWLYQANGGDRQLLASTPDNKYMLQICIAGQQLSADIYTIDQQDPNSITFTNSSHVTAQIGGLVALPWLHVVLQGNSLATGTLQIWINGQQQAVQVNGASAGCGWQVGGNPIQMPQNLAALKHLRYYNRLMDGAEILANAQSGCLMPSGQYLAWDRFNVPNPGDPTTIASNSTVETQFKEGIYPNHGLITSYAYNSTNQVVAQQTPDAGQSTFWYDYLNRLTFSQNAEQIITNDYSYTQYDGLGRIIEVGQLRNTTSLGNNQYLEKTAIENYILNGARTQLTQTIYDEKPEDADDYPGLNIDLDQYNLRKRVVASLYRENPTNVNINATYYNYDLTGNVKTLYQQIAGLGTKKLDYEYDLVSGKVNFLAYQDGQPDAFYYKYDYDAENRLINAWSSIDAGIDAKGFGSTLTEPYKRLDASYQYYLHGPLARMELGDLTRKVQGLDYAYTLQGWLKGVNGTSGQTIRDMGLDAYLGSNNASVAKDVFGFALHYYGFEDYKPIGAGVKPFSDAQSASSGFAKLYNGNIGGISLDNPTLGIPQLYTYKYDQLNRLLKTFTYNGLNTNTNTWNISANQSFREEYTYDANGNIEKLTRNGNTAIGPELMDKFTYGYNKVNGKLVNNRLRHVKDTAPAGNYTTDIDSQNDDNYTYDAIGNLTHDAQEGIAIDWNVYGKIKQITKSTGNIAYTYDATGNRVSKTTPVTFNGEPANIKTWYVRDAQGNTLAVYGTRSSDAEEEGMYWREQHLYGSGRLGMWVPDIEINTSQGSNNWNTLGKKHYELTNHLGNVLAVVNDNPTAVGDGTNTANVLSANDYYPGGMLMPGRSYSIPNSNYRYSFNGKEDDRDINDGAQDYGMRIYDKRLGRFLSVDPLTKSFPMLSSYQYASNSPIANIDLDGGEAKYYILQLEKIYNGEGKLTKTVSTLLEYKSKEAGWHMNGILPTYKFNGPLGDGELYNVEEKAKIVNSNGSSESVTTQVGSFYVPGPGDRDKTKNPFSINIKVWGKGYDPDNAASFAPGSGRTISFNLSDWDDATTGLTASESFGKPGSVKAPGGMDVLKSLAGAAQDLKANKDTDINKLRKNWGEALRAAQQSGISVYCTTCQTNNIQIGNNLTGIETNRPATDTTENHVPIKKK